MYYKHWRLFSDAHSPYSIAPNVEYIDKVDAAVVACGKDCHCRIQHFVKSIAIGDPYPHVVLGGYPFPADLLLTTLSALCENSNILLYGPPGTGKSFFAGKLCRWLDPYGCAVRAEPQLIPERFGVDPFRVFRRASAAVLDDLFLLALPRRTSAESRGLAIVIDVATRLLTFLSESYGVRIVIATTNMDPSHMDYAITSRFKMVPVPPPPVAWWSVLEKYGFRVVNKVASSYREALWGTSKPVEELAPECRRKRWEVDRVAAYRLIFYDGYRAVPVAYELYADVARRITCGRPIVIVNTIGGVEYLGYYRRPVVVMPPIMQHQKLLEIAYEYKATILSPTAEEHLDVTEETAEVCGVAKLDEVRHRDCVKRRYVA
jgi:hypothetical protein